MLEDLEGGLLEYKTVGEFLIDIKKEFGEEDKKLVKVMELKKVEQGGKTMEEFVQEFQRAARGSRYEERPLMEEFKRKMNGVIRKKSMKAEKSPTSIEQWYKCAINLDRYWRESRKEEKRLRGQWELGTIALKQNNEMQRQQMPQPQVWPRKQEVPQQRAQIGPALMEGVERINVVMACPQQRVEFAQ